MKKRKLFSWKLLVVVFCVLFVIILAIFWPRIVRGEIVIDENKYYGVTYVIDGDTFKVKIGWKEVTVRMLGIDTPETVDPRKPAQCYGKEASDESKKILIGQKVQMKLNPNREIKDKYGRYLVYVYLEDETFVNKYLLENGFAREYTFGKPYMMRDDFVATQNEAKQRGVGLWGFCKYAQTDEKI